MRYHPAPNLMHLLLPLLLSLAPPGRDYDQASADLQSAIQDALSEDRAAAIANLERAIEASSQFPGQVSPDGLVAEPLLIARVILVRLHLADKNDEAARAVMDDLVRMVGEAQEPPVRSYGREVSYLYEDRKAALDAAGTASLSFECEVACEIVLDDHALPADGSASATVHLGTHRVWIRAEGAEPGSPGDWSYQELEIAEAGATQAVAYADPTPAPVEVDRPRPPPKQTKKKRMLPRAAEIAGMAAGVGLIVAGAVMLGYDGKCSGTGDPPFDGISPDECGDIYESSVGSIALLGVGGGLLVVSGVLLAVDEVRVGKAKGTQVMLGARFRF